MPKLTHKIYHFWARISGVGALGSAWWGKGVGSLFSRFWLLPFWLWHDAGGGSQ